MTQDFCTVPYVRGLGIGPLLFSLRLEPEALIVSAEIYELRSELTVNVVPDDADSFNLMRLFI